MAIDVFKILNEMCPPVLANLVQGLAAYFAIVVKIFSVCQIKFVCTDVGFCDSVPIVKTFAFVNC